MIAALVVSSAYAQEVEGGELPELNAQNFRPTVDGARTLWVDDAQRAPEGPVGRLLFHYTANPFVYQQTDADGEVIGTNHLVGNIVQADLIGGYALGPVRIGVVVPIYLLAGGDTGNASGLGDLAVDGKVTVIDGDVTPIDVAVQGRIGLPTATALGDLPLGNPNLGWEVAAVASKRFGPVLIAANGGTRGGPDTELQGETQPLRLNDAFLFRGGLGYDFVENFGVAAEVAGNVAYSASLSTEGASPVEGLLSGWGRPGGDVVIRAGVGSGLTTGVGSPQFRAIVGIGYQPAADVVVKVVDSDGDGLLDPADACPLEAEDADQWQDEDGCPDPDNDSDGIVDASDQCRNEPEDKDTWKDEDGCPDPDTQLTVVVTAEDGRELDLAKGQLVGPTGQIWPLDGGHLTVEVPADTYTLEGRAGTYVPNTAVVTVVDGPPMAAKVALEKQKNALVVVTRDRIDLQDKIYFETGKATIKPESFGLLDQAVQILKDYPEIALLRIEGHTDSRGSDASNLKLSVDRSASVRQYMIDHGVSATRLTSQGFGETRPLDPANNETAWSKNRRVDFFIERWEDKPQGTIEVTRPQ